MLSLQKNIKGIWTFNFSLLLLSLTLALNYVSYFILLVRRRPHIFHSFPFIQLHIYFVITVHSFLVFFLTLFSSPEKIIVKWDKCKKLTWCGDCGGCGDGLQGAPTCCCETCCCCWFVGPGLWTGGAWGDCDGGKFEWGPGLAAGDGH